MTVTDSLQIRAPKVRRRKRTVFVSLPDNDLLVSFLERHLNPSIEYRFSFLRGVSYRSLRHGRWLPQIENAIAHSNAIVAFLPDLNPNVMLEIGQALALGKPVIPVAAPEVRLPSMLSHVQVIRYSSLDSLGEMKESIVDAVELAVLTVLHRERSDDRTKIQKRLLLGGNPIARSREYESIARKRRSAEDLLSRARREYAVALFDRASETLSRCIEGGLKLEEVYHLLADTWFLSAEASTEREDARESYEEMLRHAESGLERYPRSFLLRKDRALALMKIGNYPAAERQLRELMEEQAEGVVFYNYACLSSLRGDRLGAISNLEFAIQREKYYRELARIDPDFDAIWEDPLFQALVFGSNR